MPGGCGGRARWRCGEAGRDLWSRPSNPAGSTVRGRRPRRGRRRRHGSRTPRAAARHRRDALGGGPAGGRVGQHRGFKRKPLILIRGGYRSAQRNASNKRLLLVDRRTGRQFECAEVKLLGASGSDGSSTSVKAASGNCRQIARSSAVTVSQPYLNMYSPGSVTRPARCHVTLLTTDQPPWCGVLQKIFVKIRRPDPADRMRVQSSRLRSDWPQALPPPSARVRCRSGLPAIAARSRAGLRKAASPAHGFRPEIRPRHGGDRAFRGRSD